LSMATRRRSSIRSKVRTAAALLSLPAVCITLNALSGARYQPHGVGE
jgi:hypothetical protein